MPTAQSILHLTATYGYPGLCVAVFVGALGIGVPIPVTVLLLTLGALSGVVGGPGFVLLTVAGVAGAVGGHTVDYWGGRLGRDLVERHRRRPRTRRSTRLSGLLHEAMRARGWRAALIFVSRFLLTSIASPVSMLAGVTRMGFGYYLGLEALGEAIYVVGNLALGRAFGPGLLTHGGVLPLFWIGATLLTLLPLVLLRVALRVLGRAHPAEPALAE